MFFAGEHTYSDANSGSRKPEGRATGSIPWRLSLNNLTDSQGTIPRIGEARGEREAANW